MSSQVLEKQQTLEVNSEHHQIATTEKGEREAGALMHIIERLSVMPELDIDRVERLFDMHQKMVERGQEQAFNAAMAAAQCEIEGVVANRQNDFTKSTYADLEAIHASAKPIWTKHGFSVMTRAQSEPNNNFVCLICEVRHAAGHKVVFKDNWPLDLAGSQGNTNKTPIQGKGSTITYARRYTELMIFDIAIKDEDTDGNPAAQRVQQQAKSQQPRQQKTSGAVPATEKQIGLVRKRLAASGVNEDDLVKNFNLRSLDDLPKNKVDDALQWIQS